MSDPDLTDWSLPPRTNTPYDAPDALALVEAVAQMLQEELMPRAQGADRWVLRISANALSIAAREIELGPGHRSAHDARLQALGAASERELSQQIREGVHDDAYAEVWHSLLATARDKLEVANPGYGDVDDGGDAG